MNQPLSISKAAEVTGLSAHTLRYYEKIGLIATVDRRSGARRYSEADMRWLEFLVRLRATGMSMRDMQLYAQLLREGLAPASAAKRQVILEEHAERVEADMKALGDTLKYIRKKIRSYKEMQLVPKSAPEPRLHLRSG
ncbi:MerR family transcriptional regulator [Polaromonas sp.]|uniref:MerR family transcriptional regulator n=1 Tax=Polaromonas sp. TaxID=1869339 RepID=UPI0017F92540|nr:MerR family transcriptional regulator [Polaromonas sp.]NMM07777.1 MerR family transcriptional regulator [Polaromonas sp.]